MNIYFENLAFRLPWPPIKISDLDKFIWLVEDYSEYLSVKLFQNICSNTEINANFHFSHYKYINTIYVEANVMNIYAKFNFIPFMASEKEMFEYFSKV